MPNDKSHGAFILRQAGTDYYKVGYVEEGQSFDQLLKWAQEGSSLPLVSVRWSQAGDGSPASLADKWYQELLDAGAVPAYGGWLKGGFS